MKVQLIQPSTGEYRSNSRSGCYPPLGLVSMATYIRQQIPHVEVEILDAELFSDNEIIAALDADIVAINANTVTYPQAILIAEAAKQNHARVVLGGVHVSAIPEIVLQKRGHIVDSLVVGYGEIPMVDIIRGDREKLIINHQPAFDRVPFPDRSLVDLESYVGQFRRQHATWDYRGTNIFTNVGCAWKAQSAGGCIFCSRSGTTPYHREPRNIWTEVRELIERYDVDYIVDFSDTALQNKAWLKSLVETKPPELKPRWHIFGRIDEIDLETLNLLKKLPCHHIFVGIESGDPEIYRTIRKGGGSPERSLKMASLLSKYEIKLTPSYVIGLPGETEQSLQRTAEHAYRLKEITDFEEVFCCELIPFPGSFAFRQIGQFCQPNIDCFDIEFLKRVWTETKCLVQFHTLQTYIRKILALGRYKITISTTPISDPRIERLSRDIDSVLLTENTENPKKYSGRKH